MTTSTYPRLLGDIGGTNARFAWRAEPGSAISDAASYPGAQFASLQDAMRHYLCEQGKPVPPACAIGIANPIVGDQVRMTNHDWAFSIAQVRSEIGLQRLLVINDFSALALALPELRAADLRQVGGGRGEVGAPLALIGPGTGLGVSGLLPMAGGRQAVLNGEGGHVTLCACDDTEARVVAWLHRRFGHASAERALSGPGLVNLYEAACEFAALPAQRLSPPQVIDHARSGADAACMSAVQLFCNLLGSVTGNLALTLGARGGVYVGGGIAPHLLPEIEASRFRERFESKGRFRDYLAAMPTFIIDAATSPALLGASRALDAVE